jgi:hypothetical protein
VISDPSQPHAALATAATVDALATRTDTNFVVYVNQDGLSHAVDPVEQHQLDGLVQAAQSLAESAELSDW